MSEAVARVPCEECGHFFGPDTRPAYCFELMYLRGWWYVGYERLCRACAWPWFYQWDGWWPFRWLVTYNADGSRQ